MKLLKLYKNGCAPCLQMSLFLEERGIEHEQVNIMENIDVAVQYNVMSVPVLILLDDDGNEVERSNGFVETEIDGLILKLNN